MNESDIFIRILRLGEAKGAQGLNESEFKEWSLRQPEVRSDQSEEYIKIIRLFRECFERIPKSYGTPDEYVLKAEYYFRLLEFQELELSRQAATSANRFSKAAIGVSLMAVVIGSLASIAQLTASVSIDDSQVAVLQDAVSKLESIEFRLNDEQQSKFLNSLDKTTRLHEEVLGQLQNLNKSMQPTADAPAD